MEKATFTLDQFEGPLDLLLYLISKNKMKIADIEIVSLIDQYLAVINGPAGAALEETSEFIEMAARLIYMKSVFLLPRSEESDQLREELTGMLVEYSACREVAARLGRMADGVFIAVRQPAQIELDCDYHIRHDPKQLSDAYEALMGRCAHKKAQPQRDDFDPIVSAPFVSVASRIVHVLRGLVAGKVRQLKSLFESPAGRSETVATFLAVLELMKAGRITLDESEQIRLNRRTADRRE